MSTNGTATQNETTSQRRVDLETFDLSVAAGECVICQAKPKFMGAHLKTQHGIISGRGQGKTMQTPRQVGETVTVGPTPAEVVTITVSTTTAERSIKVHILSMAETFDLIAGFLRQQLEKKGR